MKRTYGYALVGLLLATALPAGVVAAQEGVTYALSGSARALEGTLGGQGLTLGVALSRADSEPSAAGLGAGQCQALGQDPAPEDAACSDETTERSSYPGDPGDAEEKCATPAFPDPFKTILDAKLACGFSQSGLEDSLPFTHNRGRVGEIDINLDLSGLSEDLEEGKDTLIEELEKITGQFPEPIPTAVNSILDALAEGEAGTIELGPASSNIDPDGDVITVVSTAEGTRIGLLGIPTLDKEGEVVPDSADPLETGLLIIELGRARASASVDLSAIDAEADAEAAAVTIKVRDITKTEPTYVEIELAPGQSQTLFEGTPLETTITAAGAQTEDDGTSARAAADAVHIHLFKGLNGGLELGLARATAAATIDQVLAARQRPPSRELPRTGAPGLALIGLILLAAALGLAAVRRLAR